MGPSPQVCACPCACPCVCVLHIFAPSFAAPRLRSRLIVTLSFPQPRVHVFRWLKSSFPTYDRNSFGHCTHTHTYTHAQALLILEAFSHRSYTDAERAPFVDCFKRNSEENTTGGQNYGAFLGCLRRTLKLQLFQLKCPEHYTYKVFFILLSHFSLLPSRFFFSLSSSPLF